MTALEKVGWAVFFLSGVAFLVSGVATGDGWVIGGSVLFIVGVLAVLFGRKD